MKRILLTSSAFLLFLSASFAGIIYVTPNGVGDGSSWKDAASLTQALATAQAGDEVWAAQGTYLPSTTADRTSSFHVPNGVKLLGGFLGEERKAEKRNPFANLTILSGEIGNPESLEDNSHTIVVLDQADQTTIIDGFVIASAYADGLTEGVNVSTCGGAVFINAKAGHAAPQLINCTFQDNFAREGAAIYVYAEEGVATPTIRDCKFLRNRADFNGGAIFNDGNYGTCNPNISLCYFEGNRSMYGAGILNRGLYGNCTPIITECTFSDNFSTVRGSVVYNVREGRGTIEATMTGNLIYDDNGTSVGDPVDESQRIELETEEESQSNPAFRIRSSAY